MCLVISGGGAWDEEIERLRGVDCCLVGLISV